MIMAFKKFNEYLNEKGKVEENPPKMPEKAYSKKIRAKKDKNALGHHGNKKLVYEPKTEPLQSKSPEWHKEKENGPNLPKPSKLAKVGPTNKVSKVTEWIKKTKGMSLSEFAKNIQEEKNVEIDYSKIKSVQDLIAMAVSAMKTNPKLIENVVREIKRSKLSESVLNELMKDKNLYESVAGPVGFEKLYDDESEDSDEVEPEDDSGEVEDEYDDEGDEGDEDYGSEEDSEDSDSDEGDEDYGSEEDSDEDGSEEEEDGMMHHKGEEGHGSDDSEDEDGEDYGSEEDSEDSDEDEEDSDEEDDYEDSDNYDDDESEEDYGGDEEESDEDEDYFGKFGKYNR